MRRADAGLRVETAPPEGPADRPGARIVRLSPDGAAAAAGLAVGDLIVGIAGRPVRKGSDVTTAFYLQRPGDRVEVVVRRDGARQARTLEMQER